MRDSSDPVNKIMYIGTYNAGCLDKLGRLFEPPDLPSTNNSAINKALNKKLQRDKMQITTLFASGYIFYAEIHYVTWANQEEFTDKLPLGMIVQHDLSEIFNGIRFKRNETRKEMEPAADEEDEVDTQEEQTEVTPKSYPYGLPYQSPTR